MHGKPTPALRASSRYHTRTPVVIRGSRSLTAPVILPPPYATTCYIAARRVCDACDLHGAASVHTFSRCGEIQNRWRKCPQVHRFLSTKLHAALH